MFSASLPASLHEDFIIQAKHSPPRLKALIAAILSSEPISEHQLICQLQQAGAFTELTRSNPLSLLFCKHFLTMHTLYLLQEEFLENRLHLHISALEIRLLPLAPEKTDALAPEPGNNELRAFYLNLENLEQANDESVADLLADFSARFAAWSQEDESLEILGLQRHASWPEIRQRYRQLAARHHPDKGGDQHQFVQLRQAWEKLNMLRGRG